MKRLVILSGVMALLLLTLPATGFGQGSSFGYGRDRNNNGRNYGRNVKRSAERVDKLSGQLKNDMDRALDRSRVNGRDREDEINSLVNEFHSAAARFRDRFDDGNLDRARSEANQMLTLGWRLDGIIGRRNLSNQVENRWSRIRGDLQVIQNAYGTRDSYGYR
ncbi:MAG: hypothetical protein ABIP75_17265 [Pyrinomonadaceae bacterium]